MTNCLLIHNDNLPSNVHNAFGDQVKFDIPQSKMLEHGYSFDREAHRQLGTALKDKEYDVIFLPYYLSDQNYLDLAGLRLATHIRLTPEFQHQHTPIVLIGNETPEQIAKLSDLAPILFTSGTFNTIKQDVTSFQKQYEWIIENKKCIADLEFKSCLERLNIEPPANYQSHHSIKNELALLRWSEYVRCDDRIPEVKENLKAGLYFKYHRELNPVSPPGTGSPYLIYGKGKILLIDDEAEKGWADFYDCLFQCSSQIKFDRNSYLKVDFKSLDQNQIVSKAIQWIKDNDPDAIMLDLRLCDADFDEDCQVKDHTGHKILKMVKEEISKGIQVIIITASNKVWNYQSTHDLGANGYIIKKDDSDVAEDIKSLKKTIETCLERAGYLKPSWHLTNSLKNSLNGAIKEKNADKNFFRELIKLLDLSFNMYYRASSQVDFAYAYLALFKCLELIANELTFKEAETWKVVGPVPLKHFHYDKVARNYNEIEPPNFKNNLPNTFEKISGLCFQLWNYRQADVQQLYYSIKRRNEFIHPSVTTLTANLQTECDKVYKSNGYSVLLKQISDIGSKITI